MSKFWFIWPLTCYKVRAPILCYYEIHTTDVENEIFTVGQRKYPSYLWYLKPWLPKHQLLLLIVSGIAMCDS